MEFKNFSQTDFWNMLPLSKEQREQIYKDFILTGKYDKIDDKKEDKPDDNKNNNETTDDDNEIVLSNDNVLKTNS